MKLPFCLSRLKEIEKRLTIKCGDSICKPKVYDEFTRYIVLYRNNNWWFTYYILMGEKLTDSHVKQLNEVAQSNYDMYCEIHKGE